MAYITEGQLEKYADSAQMTKTANMVLAESKDDAIVSIFLSHSHKDEKRVRGMVNLFASFNISLWVDWLDHSMPMVTNHKTAIKLKTKIRDNDLFLVLATKNALASRWVPWEIGVADSLKPHSKLLIIPVADNQGRFEGNEYLQLYKRLTISSKNQYAVFDPGKTTSGILFEKFARSRN